MGTRLFTVNDKILKVHSQCREDFHSFAKELPCIEISRENLYCLLKSLKNFHHKLFTIRTHAYTHIHRPVIFSRDLTEQSNKIILLKQCVILIEQSDIVHSCPRASALHKKYV